MASKMLIYENMRCWYEFLLEENPLRIGLRIHKEFIESNKIDFEKAPMIKHLAEKLRIAEFAGNFNNNIGFGGILKRIEEKDGFVKFMAEIPKIKNSTNKKCAECKGTGRRKYDPDEKCLICNGSGWKLAMNWEEARAISASFTVLTLWLRFCEIETSAPFFQLITIRTITTEETNGGSLSGEISISMHNWLKSLGEHADFIEAVQAMHAVYCQMFGLREANRYEFSAYAENGGLIIRCPGDASGLSPNSRFPYNNEGYEFGSNNVDSAAQQITLLAAICVLWSKAKKEIKTTTR